jgi:transcriptional regulator with XRE-family HTH domain
MSIHNPTDSAPSSLPVASPPVTAGTLAAKVFAARNARNLTATALAAACGMSPRTIRDIEELAERTYRSTTLAPLDRFFGWDEGEAWRVWRQGEGVGVAHPDAALIAAQMEALGERVRRIEEQPPWTSELIDACRLLSAADRARVLDLAHRLGGGG